MSKRAGLYISLEELIKQVGLDVARFFFLQRGANSHLIFDLELAKKKSQENPVYYVQYAYARICSILKKAGKIKPKLKRLEKTSELDLIKQLIKFPEIIEDTAKDYQVQRIPQYSIQLAESFHRFYQECQVISDDKEKTQARLALILATKVVLEETFKLMGISNPEKM
jgi:arginyl-tRNA synthetase